MQPEFFLIGDWDAGSPKACRNSGGSFIEPSTTSRTTRRLFPDEEWLAFGLERAWTPLCKDGRIKGRDRERSPLLAHRAVLFCLDNQCLVRAEMINRFHSARDRMIRAVRRGGPAAYAVNATGIRRTWP